MGDTGALLVVGATSGAGKSTVTAALCRALTRTGRTVAPFKAQNMSNHAAVTADGGEVGRAQAMQADAAGVELDRRMNPVLLKPTGGLRSHVVVLGDEVGTSDARDHGRRVDDLRPVVLDALTSLRRDHDWIVAEGAGGAAEINLLDRDLVNLPLARAAGLPAILVVDIERGGAFAAAHGSIDLLPPALRATVAGVVFNRFRGDPSLLEPGPAQLEARTGVPLLGVLPWLGPDPLLGVEDSLDLASGAGGLGVGGHTAADGAGVATGRVPSARPVRVTAIHLPHLANPSDLDPFAVEPDVTVRLVTEPGQLADADLVIVPGSRATVSDLDWLRRRGLDRALVEVADGGATVIGICGGYQLLGRRIDDPIESEAGTVDGLGLLDAVTRFEEPKIVRRSYGRLGHDDVRGYQIRFGRPRADDEPWLDLDGEPEGARSASGRVRGTSLHGLFDDDDVRHRLLAEVADERGRHYRPGSIGFTAALEAQHERLADWITDAVDLDRLIELGATATPPGDGPGW